MKVLVCGDRNWTDREAIRSWLSKLQDWGYDTIIQGHARGADKVSASEAKCMRLKVLTFPAKWEQYGRAAGPIRNQEMLDVGEPDLVVYFHNDLSKSKGTADMVRRAKKAGIEVIDGGT